MAIHRRDTREDGWTLATLLIGRFAPWRDGRLGAVTCGGHIEVSRASVSKATPWGRGEIETVLLGHLVRSYGQPMDGGSQP